MKFPTALCAVAAFAMSSPALAAWNDVSDHETCAIASSWELGTTIIIIKNIDEYIMDDDVIVLIHNDNWSLTPETPVDFTLKYEANDGAWFSNTPMATKNGLAINVSREHLDNFKYVSGISVFRDKEEIELLKWSLFSLGLNDLDRCIAKARAPIKEAERRRKVEQAVPRDPFATAKSLNEQQAKGTTPD